LQTLALPLGHVAWETPGFYQTTPWSSRNLF
jgi:hypothetical protein